MSSLREGSLSESTTSCLCFAHAVAKTPIDISDHRSFLDASAWPRLSCAEDIVHYQRVTAKPPSRVRDSDSTA
jgi:hypothetical protein